MCSCDLCFDAVSPCVHVPLLPFGLADFYPWPGWCFCGGLLSGWPCTRACFVLSSWYRYPALVRMVCPVILTLLSDFYGPSSVAFCFLICVLVLESVFSYFGHVAAWFSSFSWSDFHVVVYFVAGYVV